MNEDLAIGNAEGHDSLSSLMDDVDIDSDEMNEYMAFKSATTKAEATPQRTSSYINSSIRTKKPSEFDPAYWGK